MQAQSLKEELDLVKAHMMQHCCGYKNAKPRREIASVLRLEDRHFRQLCTEIPEIIASTQFGYWILPLVDPTGDETRVAGDILQHQDRRRIIALYLRNRKQKQAVRRMHDAERQLELVM